jgi:hypothetical protein
MHSCPTGSRVEKAGSIDPNAGPATASRRRALQLKGCISNANFFIRPGQDCSQVINSSLYRHP